MAQIGTVKEISGVAKATSADGTIRVLVLGDPIYEGDVVTAVGSDSSIKLSFDSGRELALSGDEKSLMDESIYAKEGFDNTDITAEQQALLDGGALPTEAPAAGPDGAASDGGITQAFVGENSQQQGDVDTYNLETSGAAAAAPDAINPDIVNQAPVASDDEGETFEEGKGTGDEFEAAIVATGNVLDNDVDDGLGSLGGDLDVSAVSSNNLESDGTYSSGSFTLVGEFGTLVINEKSGEYTYTVDETNQTVDALNVGDTLLEDFTYTITDGDLTDTANLAITINGTNDAPVAQIDTATTDENVILNIQILENDSDVDSDSFDLVSIDTEGLNGVAVIGDDGVSVDYNPGEFYDYLAVGEVATETFTYTITDNEGDNSKSTTQTVEVTLTGTNDQPIVSAVVLDAVNEVLDGLNENTFAAQLLVEDLDDSDTQVFFVQGADEDNAPVEVEVIDNSGVNLGISATVQMTDINTGAFQIVGDFNALAVGETATVTFEYYAVDSARDADGNAFDGTDGRNETSTSAPQTVTVTIAGTNDQPQILDVSVSQSEVIEGLNTFTGSLEETDLDVTDEHVFEMIAGSVVASGFEGEYNNEDLSVVVNPNGTYSVTGDFNTLALGESTTVTFQYTANDQNGFDGTDGVNQNSISDVKTVTLTITGTNDAPIAVADFAGFGGETAVDLTEIHTIDATDHTIGYSYFEVLGSGTTVTIHTDGPTMDPNMYLIRNDGNITSDDIISYDDDGYTSAGYYSNSIITDTLEPGSYIAVVSDYALSESELIAGFNDISDLGSHTGDVTLTFNTSSSIILGDTNGEVIYENDTFTLDVLANDTDVDHGASFTLDSLSNQTGNGQFSISGTQLLFTPGTDFDHLAVGDTETISIEYTMSDEHGAESSALATLKITGTNDTPIVSEVIVTPMVDEVLHGNNDNTFVGELIVSDIDDLDEQDFFIEGADSNNNPIAATVTDDSVVNLGITATVEMTDTDAGIFKIVGNFNALADGEKATVTFKYYAVDDNNLAGNSVHQTSTSTPETVTVTILGTNDAPIIADVTLDSTPEADTGLNTFTGNLTETDLDVTDTHDFYLVGSPDSSMNEYDSSLLVTVNLDGSYTLSGDFNTLAVGESTVVTFDYKAVDDSGTANNTSTTETVSVTITGTNDGPVAVADGGLSGQLDGNYYGSDTRIYGIADAENIAAGETPDATFIATKIDYAYGTGNLGVGTHLQNFLDHDASSLNVDPSDNNRQGVIVLEGDLVFAEGDYVFKVHSDDGYQILIDGVIAGEFTGNRGPGTNTNPSIHIDGGEHHVEIVYWDQGGAYVLNVEYSFEGEGFVTLNTNAIYTYENDAITIDVLANDTDIDHNATFTLVSLDELGVDTADEHVSIVNNELVFTPGDDFDYLAVGESTQVVVTYTMRDEHDATSTTTVTLTILGTNDQPVVSDVSFGTNIGAIVLDGDTTQVDYWNFVHNGGSLTIDMLTEINNNGNPWVQNGSGTYNDIDGDGTQTSLDVMIRVYEVNADGTRGAQVGVNDDNNNPGADGSVWNRDSYLELNLVAGNYQLVVGAWNLEQSEVDNGINNIDNAGWHYQGPYQISLYGEHGVQIVDQGIVFEAENGYTTFESDLPDVVDADNSDIANAVHTYSLVDGTLSIDDTSITDYGVVVDSNGHYTLTGDFNPLANGDRAIVTFEYTANDNHNFAGDADHEDSLSLSATVTILVIGTDDLPQISLVDVVYNNDYVIDGSFENPVVSGNFDTYSGNFGAWELDSGSIDLINGYWPASEGDQSLDLSGNSAGTVSQTFATTIGATYTVSFDMSANVDVDNHPTNDGLVEMQVSVDGFSQTYGYDYTTNSRIDMNWTTETFTFVATSTSSTISFASLENTAYGPALDNVHVMMNYNGSSFEVLEDGSLVIHGIAITDVDGIFDAATGVYEVTLTSANGLVSPNPITGTTIEEVNAILQEVTFMPNQDFNGATIINITVTDGSAVLNGAISVPHDADSLNVDVIPVNDAPIATADSGTFNEDALSEPIAPVTGSENLLDGVTDVDDASGHVVGKVSTSDGSYSDVDATDGTFVKVAFTFTNADGIAETIFIPVRVNQDGTYDVSQNELLDGIPKDGTATGSFWYQVDDGHTENNLSDGQEFTITITGQNDAPEFNVTSLDNGDTATDIPVIIKLSGDRFNNTSGDAPTFNILVDGVALNAAPLTIEELRSYGIDSSLGAEAKETSWEYVTFNVASGTQNVSIVFVQDAYEGGFDSDGDGYSEDRNLIVDSINIGGKIETDINGQMTIDGGVTLEAETDAVYMAGNIDKSGGETMAWEGTMTFDVTSAVASATPVDGFQTETFGEDNIADATASISGSINLLAGVTDVDGLASDVTVVDSTGASFTNPITVALNVDDANGNPLNVQVTVNSDGTYSIAPNSELDALAVGTTAEGTFAYKAIDSDGGLSEEQTFTIRIDGANDAPEVSDHVEALVDGTASISLATYDAADIDGGARDIEDDLDANKVTQIKIESLPTDGTLTVGGAPVTLGQVFDETVSFDYKADYSDMPVLFGTKDDIGNLGQWGIVDAGNIKLDTNGITGTITATDDNGSQSIGYQTGGIGTDDGTGIGIVGSGSQDDSQIDWTNNETMTITFDAPVANAEVGFSSVGGYFVAGQSPDAKVVWVATLDGQSVANGTGAERQDATDDGNPNTVVVNIDAPFDKIVFHVDAEYNSNYSIQYIEVNPEFSDSFTYSAIDSDGMPSGDTATVTLTGSATNFTPDASDDSLSTDEDTDLVIDPATLLANDTDSNGDVLSITGVSGDTNGTATLNQDGTITFTPTPGYTGPASFTYTVSDGDLTDTAIVNIAVNSVNEAPVIENTSNTTGTLFNGLNAEYYGVNSQIHNLGEFRAIVDGNEPDATFRATEISYAQGSGTVSIGQNLQSFLGDDAHTLSADPSNTSDGGLHMVGQVLLVAGTYNFEVRADDGYQIVINGDSVAEYAGNQGPTTRTHASFTIDSDGYYDVDIVWWDQGGAYVFQPSLSLAGGAFETFSTANFEFRAESTVSVIEAGTTDSGAVVDGIDTVTGQMVADDVDSDDDSTTLLWSTDSIAVEGTTYGSFSIDTHGEWTYNLDNNAANHLAEGDTVTETFNVVVTDSHGATDTETVTINIQGTNDVPVINLTQDEVVSELTNIDIATADFSQGFVFRADVNLDEGSNTFFRQADGGADSFLIEFGTQGFNNGMGNYIQVYIPTDSGVVRYEGDTPLSLDTWTNIEVQYDLVNGVSISLDGSAPMGTTSHGITGFPDMNNVTDDNYNVGDFGSEEFNGKVSNVTITTLADDAVVYNSGDETLSISDADGGVLDLSNITSAQSLDVINLSDTVELNLSVEDVFGATDGDHELTITGDATSNVNLVTNNTANDDTWTANGTDTNGNNVFEATYNGDTVTLHIETDITTVI